MRVALICPAEQRHRVGRQGEKPHLSRTLRSNRISLLAVAAATPEDVEVEIIDEYVQPIHFEEHYDVVGVSFMTGTAPRAYEIGDEFRNRGVTVVFGGYHPTFMPDEAIQHSDAICIGEGELNWPRMLEDFKNRKLQGFYRSEKHIDLRNLRFLRRDLLNRNHYLTTNLVLAGRGCPYSCDFCSVTYFFDQTYRTRPVNHIIHEISTLDGELILFGDDNIVGDRNFSKALFRALAPMKKKWMSQANISIAEDDELLRLAEGSGCKGIFVGLESLSSRSLNEVGKGFYKPCEYLTLIRKICDHGIAVMGGFVFGFDHDDTGVFERTIEFANRAQLAAAQIAILTPFPGTPLFSRLSKQGRIFDKDWSKYDFRHVVFKPSLMTPEDLQEGSDRVIKEFYSVSSILSRLLHNSSKWGLRNTLSYGLPLNLAYKQNLKGDKRDLIRSSAS
jgi:radical SAM superfamily enzyme YgiQ (UPF0313 family)